MRSELIALPFDPHAVQRRALLAPGLQLPPGGAWRLTRKQNLLPPACPTTTCRPSHGNASAASTHSIMPRHVTSPKHGSSILYLVAAPRWTTVGRAASRGAVQTGVGLEQSWPHLPNREIDAAQLH
ncbi:hypothetical protein BC567DRAFT_238469 [Phyllosticta citribraziliensis]